MGSFLISTLKIPDDSAQSNEPEHHDRTQSVESAAANFKHLVHCPIQIRDPGWRRDAGIVPNSTSFSGGGPALGLWFGVGSIKEVSTAWNGRRGSAQKAL